MNDRIIDSTFEVPDAETLEPERVVKSVPTHTPLGVDVGTCRIVVCKKVFNKPVSASQLNAFFSVPYLKFTQDILDKNEVSYFVDDNSLVIIGDSAEKFSVVMNSETHRPMREGLLNPTEVKGQKVIQKILELLVQQAETLGDTVCLNMPAVPSGWESRLLYHEAILKNFFMSLGYRVKTVNEGLAVVLTELADTNFSGIGISMGAGMCNGCLSFLSLPILTFGVPKAGDFIDDSVAAVMNMLPTEVRLIKENELDLSRPPQNRIENALHIFYDEIIYNVLDELRKAMLTSNKLPQTRQPVPIVLGGGTAMPKGFLEKFEKIFTDFTFPLPVSGVRLAQDPLTATVRGSLMAASSEDVSVNIA